MSAWLARIQVTLKPVVNDPEGLSVAQALHHLGYDAVGPVRAGKYFEIEIDVDTKERANDLVDSMCRRLLANPVIEEYRFTLSRPGRSNGSRRRRD